MNSYPSNIFVLKISSAVYVLFSFHILLIMGANTMIPDQTAFKVFHKECFEKSLEDLFDVKQKSC